MERKSREQELLNEIELYKQALMYYADPQNYVGEENSAILIDSGFQAKFALDSANKNSSYNEKMYEEAKKMVMDNFNNENPEDYKESLRKLDEINSIISKYKDKNA